MAQFMMQRNSDIVWRNGNAQLRHNGPSIGTFYHSVQCNARFRFTVHQHPVQRRATTIFW
ncbi:Uncharacterised protein [Shigella sonnei]|nr:Uncharacterised protein [Shigella sonnei]SRN46824.1 Uncharacterised protein [Shigella flexneri]